MKHILKGRPSALYVLDYGLFKVHANGRVIGICGFLIQTDAGENILIDTGFPAKYAADAAAASAEDNLGAFGEVLTLSDDNLPPAQLALCGITPDQIDLLIMSHTHIDHVGGLADFPNRPILIAAAERALQKPLYWGGAQPMDWPDRDYVLVDSDTEIADGFEVLLTPGHAPGQLAFLLSLPEPGPVRLTSDAISRPAEIDEHFAGSWDEPLAQHHGARLLQLAADTGATVIYGHCPEQWPTLRKAPKTFT
jgi:N-acyl homoserine lactone hydrolase